MYKELFPTPEEPILSFINMLPVNPTSCKKSSSSLLNLSTNSSSSWDRAMSTLLKIVNSSLQRA